MTSDDHASGEQTVEPQDRGVPQVNRVRSTQARVASALAIAVGALLVVGLIGWYMVSHWPGTAPANNTSKRHTQNSDSSLPPLDRSRPAKPAVLESDVQNSALATLLGPAPPEPVPVPTHAAVSRDRNVARTSVRSSRTSVDNTRAPRDEVRVRDRAGPAFVSFNERAARDDTGRGPEGSAEVEAAPEGSLSKSLTSTVVPTIRAQRLPNLRYLLRKGDSIDCTLETAIDTSLPSLVTCIGAADVYGADGTVVLIDRGAKFFGETRPAQVNAAARVAVVWTEVRSGEVVARIDSPAADPQGRGGLAGQVNRHFFQRFSAAFLVSVIEGGIDAATRSRDRNASVVVNPDDSSELLTEVLRSTADIKPTVGVEPGSRVSVLIARDVDFSSVYELTHVAR